MRSIRINDTPTTFLETEIPLPTIRRSDATEDARQRDSSISTSWFGNFNLQQANSIKQWFNSNQKPRGTISAVHPRDVETVALLGEVSKEEAERLLHEYKSVRAALASIEFRKQQRRSLLYMVIGVVAFLILGYIAEREYTKVTKSYADPSSRLKIVPIAEEEIQPFPIIFKTMRKYDFAELFQVVTIFPTEDGTDKSTCAFIDDWSVRSSGCFLCYPPYTKCNSHIEDGLLCKDGSFLEMEDPYDYDWTFCNDKGGREKCPSKHFPMMQATNDSAAGGQDYGCVYRSEDFKNFRDCPDGFSEVGVNSTCHSATTLHTDKDDLFNMTALQVPGIHRMFFDLGTWDVWMVTPPSVPFLSDEYSFRVDFDKVGQSVQYLAIHGSIMGLLETCRTWFCVYALILAEQDYFNQVEPPLISREYWRFFIQKHKGGGQTVDIDASRNTQSLIGDTWTSFLKIQFFAASPYITIFEEYVAFDEMSAIASMGGYLSIVRFVIVIILGFFLGGTGAPTALRCWFLEQPHFSLKFRRKLSRIAEHPENLDGIPFGYEKKNDRPVLDTLFPSLKQITPAKFVGMQDSIEFSKEDVMGPRITNVSIGGEHIIPVTTSNSIIA